MIEENDTENLSEELSINYKEIPKDRPETEIAVLTCKRAETTGVLLMPPLEEHRKPQRENPPKDTGIVKV